MHMLRSDDEHFERFGEIYFSVVNPGAIKAWHFHRKMTLNYACVFGMIKLVLHDKRSGSPTKYDTQEIFIGNNNYSLVIVPPMVWNGFKGISTSPSIVANCATELHHPDEIIRISSSSHEFESFSYDWRIKHG